MKKTAILIIVIIFFVFLWQEGYLDNEVPQEEERNIVKQLQVEIGSIEPTCADRMNRTQEVLKKDGSFFSFFPTAFSCDEGTITYTTEEISITLRESGISVDAHGGTTPRYECYSIQNCTGDLCPDLMLGRKLGGGVTSIFIEEHCLDENHVYSPTINKTIKVDCATHMLRCNVKDFNWIAPYEKREQFKGKVNN